MPNSNASIEQVRAFVKKNVVPAQQGRKCVDGRYLPTQSTGMIARPGGDGGYVMALIAVNKKKQLGMTPEQCFTAIYEVLVRNNEKFFLHTDHHADPDEHTRNGLIGCGHLVKASTEVLCKAYDVEGKEVEQFVEHARNVAKTEPSMEIVNLAGEHEERGVLVINSDAYSVHAANPEMKQMYFIYDEQRDTAFLRKLVTELAIDGVTFEDMKKESDIQLHATLHNLAIGLPIYSVAFEDSNPQVAFVDTVH